MKGLSRNWIYRSSRLWVLTTDILANATHDSHHQDRSEWPVSYPSPAFYRKSIEISNIERASPFTGACSSVMFDIVCCCLFGLMNRTRCLAARVFVVGTVVIDLLYGIHRLAQDLLSLSVQLFLSIWKLWDDLFINELMSLSMSRQHQYCCRNGGANSICGRGSICTGLGLG